MAFPIKHTSCPFCSFEATSTKGLSYHMSIKHNMTFKEYDKVNTGTKCKICGKPISSNRIFCSNKCKFKDSDYNTSRSAKRKADSILAKSAKQKIEYKHTHTCLVCNEYVAKSNNIVELRMSIGTHLGSVHKMKTIDYVIKFNLLESNLLRTDLNDRLVHGIECPLCKKKFKQLNMKHLKTHDITYEEFVETYPAVATLCVNTKKKKSIATSLCNFGSKVKFMNTVPELLFKDILNNSNIPFVAQYKTRENRGCNWDFYIESMNLIVEIDGYRHKLKDKKKGFFYETIINDHDKNDEAASIGIALSRIDDDDLDGNIVIESIQDIIDISYFYQNSEGLIEKDYPFSYKDILHDRKTVFLSRNTLLTRRLRNEDWKTDLIKNDVQSILSYIRRFFPSFPYQHEPLLQDKMKEIIAYLQKVNVSKYVSENNIINTNNLYCSNFKKHFINFYKASTNRKPSMNDAFFMDSEVIESILYRVGINNSKDYTYELDTSETITCNETFNISVENIVNGIRMKNKSVSFFYPVTSYSIINYLKSSFSIKDGSYLYDPSAGYGVRYLTTLANNLKYVGTDADKETINYLNDMKNNLQDDSVFLNEKSENVKEINQQVSLIFSCPPYWNKESYSFDIERYYKDYKGWLEGFVLETAKNCYTILNEDPKICAYVISNKMKDDFISIYKSVGFELLECKEIVSSKHHFSRRKGSKSNSSESLIIFHKV